MTAKDTPPPSNLLLLRISFVPSRREGPHEELQAIDDLIALRNSSERKYAYVDVPFPFNCPHCHQKLTLRSDGHSAFFVEDCVEERVGTEIEISIPSGKIALARSLQDVLAIPYPENRHFRGPGQKEYMRMVAPFQVVSIPESEVFEEVLFYPDGSYQLGYWIGDGEGWANLSRGTTRGATSLGELSINPGGMNFLDYEYALDLCEDQGKDPEDVLSIILEVPPGTYKFTYYHNIKYRPEDTEILHLNIERVGKATDLKETLNLVRNRSCHVSQFLQSRMEGCPSINGETLEGTLALHHFHSPMQILEGGVFERMGFEQPQGFEIKELERFRRYVQVPSQGYAFLVPAEGLNENDKSFARAQLLFIEAFLSFGTVAVTEYPYNRGTQVLERIEHLTTQAIRVYKETLKIYPDLGEGLEDFTQWLEDQEAVEAYLRGRVKPYMENKCRTLPRSREVFGYKVKYPNFYEYSEFDD